MTHNLQFIGLIYDAAGIVILGIPAVFRMVDEIAAQSRHILGTPMYIWLRLYQPRVLIPPSVPSCYFLAF